MTSTTEHENREAFLQAVEVAKLEAMKELAYGASHEINNPLANIAARAQSLLKRIDDPADRRMLEAIHRQAMRAHEMISDLMLFARPPAIEHKPVRLALLLAGAAERLRPLAEERSIRFVTTLASPALECSADPLQLAVAVEALVENAIEAIGESGEIGLEAAATVTTGLGATGLDPDSSGQIPSGIAITVRDTGPGVPDELRPRIFDPFFSGREAGRGLGFGLSKCWRIVTDHGGTVEVDSPAGGGAVFTIRLPAATPLASGASTDGQVATPVETPAETQGLRPSGDSA